MTLGDLADKLAELKVAQDERTAFEIAARHTQHPGAIENAHRARDIVDRLRAEVLCVCGALK